MAKGKFIVLEGIDGSGKTTQAHALAEKFKAAGQEVFITWEASENPIGKFLRETYLEPRRDIALIGMQAIDYLFTADRFDRVMNVIYGFASKLKEGVNVISDRYILSNMVYNTYPFIELESFDAYANLVKHYEKHMYLIMRYMPDVTFYLDLHPDEAMRRINNRAQRDADKLSGYEKDGKFKNIYETYEMGINYIQNICGWNVQRLNAMLPADIITNAMWDNITNPKVAPSISALEPLTRKKD